MWTIMARLAPACLPAPRRAVLRVWFCDDAVATVAAADAAEARARSPAEPAFRGRTRAAPLGTGAFTKVLRSVMCTLPGTLC